MATIDVIVPVYKVEKYLGQCIESILSQTYNDFRLLLINDGSPDRCLDICREYETRDDRITVIDQKNMGVSVARNVGIELSLQDSSSKWITFIDSDDWIHPKYLEYLVCAAESTGVGISACGVHSTNSEKAVFNETCYSCTVDDTEHYFVERNFDAVVPWGKLYNKQAFKSVRYPKGKRYEDEYTTYKVLFTYPKIAIIETPLYYYYQNPKGFMNSGWTPARLDMYQALEEQIQYFKDMGYDTAKRSVIRRYLLNIHNKLKKTTIAEEIAFLKKKKNENLKEYAKQLDLNDDRDSWVMTQIYPIKMKIYWYMIAAKNRVNHFIKK